MDASRTHLRDDIGCLILRSIDEILISMRASWPQGIKGRTLDAPHEFVDLADCNVRDKDDTSAFSVEADHTEALDECEQRKYGAWGNKEGVHEVLTARWHSLQGPLSNDAKTCHEWIQVIVLSYKLVGRDVCVSSWRWQLIQIRSTFHWLFQHNHSSDMIAVWDMKDLRDWNQSL